MNMQRLVKKIQGMEAKELDCVFAAALDRKIRLYPDWEIIYLALKRDDPVLRKQMVRQMLQILEQEASGGEAAPSSG